MRQHLHCWETQGLQLEQAFRLTQHAAFTLCSVDNQRQCRCVKACTIIEDPKTARTHLSLNGRADGSMQLIQLVLQLQLVGLCMARAAVEEAGGAVPGLLPAPRGVQPAGLQHTAHLKKKLLLQSLHALLHLKGAHQSW